MKPIIPFLLLMTLSTHAQVFDAVNPPPPVASGLNRGKETQITVPPPPLVINGKKDKDLTDDEQREFLQEKVKTINQDDGQIELIRVAPGYPVTLRFSEPIQDIAIGDKGLLTVQNKGRVAEISAVATQGDTPVKFLFSGAKIRPYHVFVVDTFLNGDSMVSVEPFDYSASQPYHTPNPRDLTQFIKILANYDALRINRQLDPRKIRRTPIFKENPATGFTLYYLYQINGALAYTFRYANPTQAEVHLDESRLRVEVGNGKFIPDFVSFSEPVIAPHSAITGYLVLFNPAFAISRPVEIIWK